MAALMTITVAVPIAGASTITTVVSPSTNSANMTAYVNTTATLKTNNTFWLTVEGLIGNRTDVSTVTLTSGNQTFADLQNALRENTSSATISYLMIDSSLKTTQINSEEIMANYSLKIVMNITGIVDNNTINLGWRAFNTNKSVSINNVDYNHISLGDKNMSSSSVLNFSAFSKPLNEWKSSYSTSTNQTTFTNDAGFTLNYYKNTTTQDSFTNFSVKSDPSYTIIAPGHVDANANTLTIVGNPGSSSMYLYYYGIVVVIIAIGLGVAFNARRRRKS